MRLIIILLFISVVAIGQPGTPDANGTITPGPPWVTGTSTGQGELELQFDYVDDKVNVNTNRADTDSAKIDISHAMLQDSLGWFNVLSYGAVGDGITDDTEAIQATIDAAVDGTVYFPIGDYAIYDSLLIIYSPKLLGVGTPTDESRDEGTSVITGMVNKPIFYVHANSGTWEYGGSFERLKIIGVDDVDSTENDGIVFDVGADWVVDRCHIQKCYKGISFDGHITHTYGITVKGSEIIQNHHSSIYGRGIPAKQVNAINIIDNHIQSNAGYGVNVFGVNVNIKDNIIESNDSAGIFISARDLGEVTCETHNTNIVGNYLEANGGGEILAEVYWDGGSVFQQVQELNISENYIYSFSAAIDKPEIDHLITLVYAAGSTTDVYMFDNLRVGNNTMVYSDIGILDGGMALGNDCVIDMPYGWISGLYSNLGQSANSEGPIKVIGGRANVTPKYTTIVAGSGITFAMLFPEIRVNISGAVNITANPQIADGYSGQVITLVGESDILTLDDGNGLSLKGGQMLLGQNDFIKLEYIQWSDLWVEKFRSTPYWENITVTGTITGDATINFAADGQANDDYEIDIPSITTLTTGLTVTFTATTANTDGATLEITSVGDLDAILKLHDQALVTGDIEAGQVVMCVFNGTSWEMISQLAQ